MLNRSIPSTLHRITSYNVCYTKLLRAADGIPLDEILRIATGGHDDADGRFVVPLQGDAGEAAAGAGEQHRHQVGLEPGEQRLGLGIAEAGVELV